MDNFKRKTIKNYTAWDINCPYIGSRRWKRRLKITFKRTARRKLKQEIWNGKIWNG